MMNSHGMEISIARCVEEMVQDPNPLPFFSFFFLFLNFLISCALFNCELDTKTMCNRYRLCLVLSII